MSSGLFDESDVRVRPNPRGSRPRSKLRPRHEHAAAAMVTGVDRGRYRLQIPPDSGGRSVTAIRARELGRRSLAVGDLVSVVGDTSGAEGSLARIVAVRERTTSLRRTADDTDPVERVIVANAEQLAVVTAVADPPPRFGFIDRALVAGYDGGLRPLIVVTKTDLGGPEKVSERYGHLGVPMFAVHRAGDLGPLRQALRHRATVMIGQSGVGKSTLVNALAPRADRATGTVNDVTGRGRHTSTSVEAIPLPDGGWIIDTPGVRSFGLAHVDLGRVLHAFSDLEPGSADCPRACQHLDEHCALDAYVARGGAGPDGPGRLASLRRLLSSMSEG